MRSINPACKLIGLLVPTFFLASLHQPLLNLAVFVLCLAALLLSKVRLKTLCFSLLPVLLAAAGMFFTGWRFDAGGGMPVNAEALRMTDSALWNGLTLASRVLAFAGLGFLFVLTTDRIELVQSAQQQLHLPQVFAYGLLAAWGMLPAMLREYKRTRAAFRARGMRVFAVSPALLKPLMVKSVRWSEALSVAMESKGFSKDHPRTVYRPIPLRARDIAFAALCIGASAAAVFLF